MKHREAFCIGCGAKNATGLRTGDDLLVQYPQGCHYCSLGTSKTRDALREMIAVAGHAFVDEEGEPHKPTVRKPK